MTRPVPLPRLSDRTSAPRKLPWSQAPGCEPHLPALVGRAVVGVMLGDVGVDPAQGQLPVLRGGDGLHDQLRVGVGRLRLVLWASRRRERARACSSPPRVSAPRVPSPCRERPVQTRPLLIVCLLRPDPGTCMIPAKRLLQTRKGKRGFIMTYLETSHFLCKLILKLIRWE